MATGSEISSESVSVTKTERESRKLSSSQLDTTIHGSSLGELQKVEGGLDTPDEIIRKSTKIEDFEAAPNGKNETVSPIFEGNINTSEGENFLASPSLSNVAARETCGAYDIGEANEELIKEGGFEEETQLQKDQISDAKQDRHGIKERDKIDPVSVDMSLENETEDEKSEKSSEFPLIKNIEDHVGEKLSSLPILPASVEQNLQEGQIKTGDESKVGERNGTQLEIPGLDAETIVDEQASIENPKNTEDAKLEFRGKVIQILKVVPHHDQEVTFLTPDSTGESLKVDAAEACIRGVSKDSNEVTDVTTIKQDVEQNIQEAECKEKEKSTNLAGMEKGSQAIGQIEKTEEEKQHGEESPKDSLESSSISTVKMSAKIQNDEEDTLVNKEEIHDDLDIPSLAMSTETSLEKIEPQEGGEHEETSNLALEKESPDSIDSSKKIENAKRSIDPFFIKDKETARREDEKLILSKSEVPTEEPCVIEGKDQTNINEKIKGLENCERTSKEELAQPSLQNDESDVDNLEKPLVVMSEQLQTAEEDNNEGNLEATDPSEMTVCKEIERTSKYLDGTSITHSLIEETAEASEEQEKVANLDRAPLGEGKHIDALSKSMEEAILEQEKTIDSTPTVGLNLQTSGVEVEKPEKFGSLYPMEKLEIIDSSEKIIVEMAKQGTDETRLHKIETECKDIEKIIEEDSHITEHNTLSAGNKTVDHNGEEEGNNGLRKSDPDMRSEDQSYKTDDTNEAAKNAIINKEVSEQPKIVGPHEEGTEQQVINEESTVNDLLTESIAEETSKEGSPEDQIKPTGEVSEEFVTSEGEKTKNRIVENISVKDNSTGPVKENCQETEIPRELGTHCAEEQTEKQIVKEDSIVEDISKVSTVEAVKESSQEDEMEAERLNEEVKDFSLEPSERNIEAMDCREEADMIILKHETDANKSLDPSCITEEEIWKKENTMDHVASESQEVEPEKEKMEDECNLVSDEKILATAESAEKEIFGAEHLDEGENEENIIKSEMLVGASETVSKFEDKGAEITSGTETTANKKNSNEELEDEEGENFNFTKSDPEKNISEFKDDIILQRKKTIECTDPSEDRKPEMLKDDKNLETIPEKIKLDIKNSFDEFCEDLEKAGACENTEKDNLELEQEEGIVKKFDESIHGSGKEDKVENVTVKLDRNPTDVDSGEILERDYESVAEDQSHVTVLKTEESKIQEDSMAIKDYNNASFENQVVTQIFQGDEQQSTNIEGIEPKLEIEDHTGEKEKANEAIKNVISNESEEGDDKVDIKNTEKQVIEEEDNAKDLHTESLGDRTLEVSSNVDSDLVSTELIIKETAIEETTDTATLKDKEELNKNPEYSLLIESSREETIEKESSQKHMDDSSVVPEVSEEQVVDEEIIDTLSTRSVAEEAVKEVSQEVKKEPVGEAHEELEPTSKSEATKKMTVEEDSAAKDHSTVPVSENSQKDECRELGTDDASGVTGKQIAENDGTIKDISVVSIEEEAAREGSQEDKMEAERLKNVKESEQISMEKNFEATNHTEEIKAMMTSINEEDSTNCPDASCVRETSSEEVQQKDNNEKLAVSEEQIKEALDKEDNNNKNLDMAPITVVTEGTSLQETEPGGHVGASNFPCEEKDLPTTETKPTDLQGIHVEHVKIEKTTNSSDKTEKEILAAEKVIRDEGEPERKCEMQVEVSDTALGFDDQGIEITTQTEPTYSKAPLDDKSEEKLHETSTIASKEQELESIEESKNIKDEAPVENETQDKDKEIAFSANTIEEMSTQKEELKKLEEIPQMQSDDTKKENPNQELQEEKGEKLNKPTELDAGKHIPELNHDSTSEVEITKDIEASENRKMETLKDEEGLEESLENEGQPFDKVPEYLEKTGPGANTEKGIMQLETEDDRVKNIEESFKKSPKESKLENTATILDKTDDNEETIETPDAGKNGNLQEEILGDVDPGEKLERSHESFDEESENLEKAEPELKVENDHNEQVNKLNDTAREEISKEELSKGIKDASASEEFSEQISEENGALNNLCPKLVNEETIKENIQESKKEENKVEEQATALEHEDQSKALEVVDEQKEKLNLIPKELKDVGASESTEKEVTEEKGVSLGPYLVSLEEKTYKESQGDEKGEKATTKLDTEDQNYDLEVEEPDRANESETLNGEISNELDNAGSIQKTEKKIIEEEQALKETCREFCVDEIIRSHQEDEKEGKKIGEDGSKMVSGDKNGEEIGKNATTKYSIAKEEVKSSHFVLEEQKLEMAGSNNQIETVTMEDKGEPQDKVGNETEEISEIVPKILIHERVKTNEDEAESTTEYTSAQKDLIEVEKLKNTCSNLESSSSDITEDLHKKDEEVPNSNHDTAQTEASCEEKPENGSQVMRDDEIKTSIPAKQAETELNIQKEKREGRHFSDEAPVEEILKKEDEEKHDDGKIHKTICAENNGETQVPEKEDMVVILSTEQATKGRDITDDAEVFDVLPDIQPPAEEVSPKASTKKVPEITDSPQSIETFQKASDAILEERTTRKEVSVESTETNIQTEERDIVSMSQHPTEKTLQEAEVEYQRPGEVSEIEPGEKVTLDTDKVSLFDLLQRSTTETLQMVAQDMKPQGSDEELHNEQQQTNQAEGEKTDEEKDEEEEDGDRKADSGSDAPVMVEALKDVNIKPTHKKSHNILSGVGSKVKHSIAKVKKVITGKSSHPKAPSPK
ncbi:PREDICTED: trichohyalin-like isoform X2 [Nelumbo nucifera]|uniref:Trichohyalin-like isoform X2 n=1 Tax=Nelumbo nucifera TaxID=4432 RepID=A0A1U7ZHW1_NELNU|nr:PREDICTED: trichohyalin-like isoform X2 [Nelumbo nucifera]